MNSSLHETTPGLRPAEISIDEHDEDLHQVPTYQASGKFIKQLQSPKTNYDLEDLQLSTVPDYRVFSIER